MRDSYIRVTVITPIDTRTGYVIYSSTITDEELNSIADRCLKERLESNRFDWYLGIFPRIEITDKDIDELAEFERKSFVKWERLTDEQVREANLQGVKWIY